MMRRFSLVPATLSLVLLPLAACSPAAQNETAQAAEAISADVNATMGEAIEDTEAAAEAAFGAAEARIDNAGAAISNTVDKAADKTGRALKEAGEALEDE